MLVETVKYLDEVSYEFTEEDGSRCRKTVFYYLFRLVNDEQEPVHNRESYEIEEGMDNLWLSFHDAMERLTHDQNKSLLAKAQEYLVESNKINSKNTATVAAKRQPMEHTSRA